MSKKNNALPENVQARLIEILNRSLANAIDLQLQSRQTYWNVKGHNFLSLRELFDKISEEVEEYTNLIAERIVQLGGKAEGTAHTVAGRSSLDGHLLASTDHIDTLATTLTNFGRHTRYASAQAIELKDADTADIFTEIARGIDKWLWFVQTSQQSDK
jgi:starvation-inducible DNA-binding protein